MTSFDELLDQWTVEQLLPGHPEAAEQAAQQLKGRAGDLLALADDLERISVTWSGTAAANYRARATALRASWRDGGERLSRASLALREFASTLQSARGKVQVARADFEDGLAVALRDYDQAFDEITRIAVQAGSMPPIYFHPSRGTLAGRDAGRGIRDGACVAVDSARALVRQVGDRTAAVLRQTLPPVASSGPGSGADPTIDVPELGANVPVQPPFGLSDAELDMTNVHQGQLGDCWFVAAAGVVADKDPEWIRQHIRQNEDGSWTVTFYRKDGSGGYVPVQVTVPNTVPEHGVRDGSGNPSWLSIYEKAAAQFMGGKYSDADSDFASVGMEMVTGRPSTTTILPGSLQDIQRDLQNGQVYTASSKPLVDLPWLGADQRVVPRHVYMIDEVRTVDGELKIHVVNPWGPGMHNNNTKYGELWMTEAEFKAAFLSTTRVEGRR